MFKVRVKCIDFVGFGYSSSKKGAKTKAANDFCNHLLKIGKITQKEYDKIDKHEISKTANNTTRLPFFIDHSTIDSSNSKLNDNCNFMAIDAFLNLWCLQKLNIHPWYKFNQINQRIRFKLNNKFIYTANLTFQSQVRF